MGHDPKKGGRSRLESPGGLLDGALVVKSEPVRHPRPATIALIALGGALLRFAGLGERQLWLDEIIQLKRFSGPDLLENVLALKNEIAAAPLDYLVQSWFVGQWGAGEWAARFHAALFGSLSLPLFYLTTRKVLGPRPAVLGLTCLAVYPLHYYYSREGRNYSLFLFLTLCAFYLFLDALKKGGWLRWSAFGLATALNLHTNYLAGLVLFSQALFLATLHVPAIAESSRDGPPRRRAWAAFAAAAGTAALSFLPWLALTHDAARAEVVGVLADPGLPLRIFKEISGGSYPLSLALGALWLLGLRKLTRNRRRADLSLLLCWGVLPVLLVLGLVWLRGYIFAIRQTLFATPALLMTAAVGLDGVGEAVSPRRARTATTGALTLIVALSLGTIAFRGQKELADWKGTGRYLTENVGEKDRILAPEIEFPLSFYLPDLPDRSLSLEEAARFLDCGTSPNRRESSLFLVESRYAQAHAAAVSQLRRSGRVQVQRRFQGFAVYKLGCPESGS